MPESSEGRKSSGDFLRGVCFGLLLAGIAVLAFFLLRYGTIGGGGQKGASVLTSAETQAKLWQVRNVIASEYLKEADAELLEEYMFKGIAAGLDDPYAGYYTEEELVESDRRNEGSYRGIGVVFALEPAGEPESAGEEEIRRTGEEDRIVVQSVYKDGPAWQAGILKGDVLIRVGDISVSGMDFSEVMELVRADARGEVRMTFQRDGELFYAECREDEVLLSRVAMEMTQDGIACLRIPEFTRAALTQFEECLNEAEEQKAQGLIVDVRDNPGGLLESVSGMLDDLMEEGIIVTMESRDERVQTVDSDENVLFDGPVVVLVNENSASASEVFAGVLQFYGLGYVIGRTTYGKGVVQSTFTLRDGSALRLTTESYYIAGEKSIDGVGVIPDLTVDGEKKESTEDFSPEADPQLAAALEYLRTGSVS